MIQPYTQPFQNHKAFSIRTAKTWKKCPKSSWKLLICISIKPISIIAGCFWFHSMVYFNGRGDPTTLEKIWTHMPVAMADHSAFPFEIRLLVVENGQWTSSNSSARAHSLIRGLEWQRHVEFSDFLCKNLLCFLVWNSGIM